MSVENCWYLRTQNVPQIWWTIRINCNISTSSSSQFLLNSILLNINKASKHCDCRQIITNTYGQCIEADRGSLQGSRNLIMFLPRGMRLLFIGYCVWSFLHYYVLRFYGPVNPMGSCRARSVYLTTRLLGRLNPLSG